MNIRFETNNANKVDINKIFIYIYNLNIQIPKYSQLLFTMLFSEFINNNGDIDINIQNIYGKNIIECATEYNLINLVKYLIDNGINIDSQDTVYGKTALITAVDKGFLGIVKYLVENGADVNIQDRDSHTALMIAVKNNNLEIAEYLIKNGADTEIQDRYKSTALIMAIDRNNIDMIECLLNNGASTIIINKKTNTYYTAIVRAINNRYSNIVKLLVEKYWVNINIQNSYNATAIMIAVTVNNLDMVKYLIEMGADINAKNNDGMTALDYAIKYRYSNIANYLNCLNYLT